jgi:dienelactone hydrolase
MKRAILLQLILAMFLGHAACAAAEEPAGVVWHEGEDVAEVTAKAVKAVTEKVPASGGATLFGLVLNKPGESVRYDVDLPQAIANARIVFRYGRFHWKSSMTDVKMPVELTVGGRARQTQVTFAGTSGWGSTAGEYRLASVDVGDLPAGCIGIKMTSPGTDSDITLDGFLIAPANVKLSDGELAVCSHLRITSEGYVGLRTCMPVLDQKSKGLLPIAVRAFGGSPGDVKATVTLPTGESPQLKQEGEAQADEFGARRMAFRLPQLPDGAYTLTVTCSRPAVKLTIPLTLAGDVLSGFDSRMKRLEAFAKDLAAMGPTAQATQSDFDYAAGYLKAKGDQLRHCVASPDGKGNVEYFAAKKVPPPEILLGNITRALAQYETTMDRLGKHQEPYAGRSGGFRRSFVSKAAGTAINYQLYVPTAYAGATKVPLILVLNGSRGDEDGMAAVENGKIFELAEKRGYLMVCPGYADRDEHMDYLLELIARVRAEYPKVDPSRIYATGESAGGFVSCQLACYHPEVFAAVCCCSGAGQPEWIDTLKIPTMVIQGGADNVVTPARTAKTVARMIELGVPLELHVIPSAGHDYHAEQYMTMAMDFFDHHVGGK